MGVDGGQCRDLAGHAGRDRISPVIYAWPSGRYSFSTALPRNREESLLFRPSFRG